MKPTGSFFLPKLLEMPTAVNFYKWLSATLTAGKKDKNIIGAKLIFG